MQHDYVLKKRTFGLLNSSQGSGCGGGCHICHIHTVSLRCVFSYVGLNNTRARKLYHTYHTRRVSLLYVIWYVGLRYFLARRIFHKYNKCIFFSPVCCLRWNLSHGMSFPTMCYVRPTKAQTSLCIRYFKLLTEQNLVFLSLIGGYTGSSWVYTCQNATLFEITCRGSFQVKLSPHMSHLYSFSPVCIFLLLRSLLYTD